MTAVLPGLLPADQTVLLPTQGKAVDISSTDFDCTSIFTDQAWARRIFVGTGGTVVLKHVGDSTALTYKNIASGQWMDGMWATVVKIGTTAADMIAEQ